MQKRASAGKREDRASDRLHPSQRFAAPSSIQTGSSLAELLDDKAIGLLAESMEAVFASFDAATFVEQATHGLDGMGLMQRASHIASALSAGLPNDQSKALEIVMASLGPELSTTSSNGLAPFFYLPHSCVIADLGRQHVELALDACHALTRRFTAEFCIRPLIVADEVRCLKRLKKWTRDESPHVRRLVSEGTRPRLPWGIRLKSFQSNPGPGLALLETLKDDSAEYVQRSVANHLGDLLKDNRDAALSTCQRWVQEASASRFPVDKRERRYWIVRHAVRYLAKKYDQDALELRKRAGAKRRS